MGWCPQCKNEYREGIKVCADCGCELLEEEQFGDQVPLTFGEEGKLNSLKKYLEFNKLRGVTVQYDEAEDVYELLVRKDDKDHASIMAKVFMQQEALREEESSENVEKNADENALQEDDAEESENASKESVYDAPTVYRNSSERAEDNRSSAWTLLIVGGAGLIVMILGITGIIPFRLGNPYMFYGVMCTVFLLFIIMGVVSMKNAKIFEKKAESENTLRDAMTKWYQENLDPYAIDEELMETEEVSDETPEEVLYYKRTQKIKDKFNHQFMNLDQIFLDNFIDEEVYDYIFSKKEP